LRVIELGGGSGTNAALLARRGADVTVLDYSEKALVRSRDFFAGNNVVAEFVCRDALDLPAILHEQFDVSMSFGLSEHFRGEQRLLINKSHIDVLKKGGIALISVPNSLNPPYRIYKFAAEILGVWKAGEEHPYTRGELKSICARLGIKQYVFVGDSVYSSLNFINPVRAFKKILNLKPSSDLSTVRLERGTPVDEYFSYALVLCAFKD
jgi:SAM-dependent methyltransferase